MGNLIAKIAPNSDLSTDLLPPSSKFNPERDIPDLSGKIVLVTGGNAGIGYHTVKQLLLKNAKVYLAARSKERGKAAIERLGEETGGKTAVLIQLDLADLASVRRAANEFLALESRLDILFNNGGVMVTPTRELTPQNHDLQFGTNVIGHFFLTELLLPALMASHPTTQVPARIINTSSSGHKFAATGIDFVSLEGGAERDAWIKKFNSESKASASTLAKTYPGVIVSCALHPGSVRTDLQKNLPSWMQVMLDLTLPPASSSNGMGACTQLWAGTTAPHEQINGKYLIPWARMGRADPIATSERLEEETIAYLREQVQGF